jgi:two-component system, OmpR family, sensor histidine kinase BaeS
MILSYLAVALLTVLVVGVLIRLTSGQSLMNLVVGEQTSMLKQSVQDYYSENGKLDGFFDDFILRTQSTPRPPKPAGQNPPPDNRNMRGVHGLVDTNYTALIPTLGYSIGQTVPMKLIKQKIAVDVNGKTIAWILPDTSFQFQLSAEEKLFLQRTNLAIGLAALAGILAAVAMGFFLAGRLLKPIRLLTRASKALAQGSLEQQVAVTSQDELGQLTTTFNQMSTDLARSDQERKRMTADITHDLSTPLQIISGYIEMLEDGGVQLTPQRIEVIKTELGHLRRLVGDLGTLTQVEGGGVEVQMQPIQPAELLATVYHAFQPITARQGIDLVVEVAEPLPHILADEGRMIQVLKNLLENAMRYTPKGGKIILGAQASGAVQLWVQDSGEGIGAEDLAYVFERFYRADKARGGNSGKMGLGLAICKALVTAQGGSIAAESAGKGQGTRMLLSFAPLAEQAALRLD